MTTLPTERTHVELPFIGQLTAMGWQLIEGVTEVPYFTERASFREVLLTGRICCTLRRINLYYRRSSHRDYRVH